MSERPEIPLREIPESEYSRILTYPHSDLGEARLRVEELSQIGIRTLRFQGETKIGGIPVLGKGCVGIVILARLGEQLVALKLRRLDADRATMHQEGRLLRIANSVDVGPRLVVETRNFLVMERIEGVELSKWAERLQRDRRLVERVIEELLWACFRLDSVGIDHGELSHAPKNVLVGRSGAHIVDFETASTGRRVANVTSILQYFMFGRISKALNTRRIFPNRRRVISILAEYKNEGSVESFKNLLDEVGF